MSKITDISGLSIDIRGGNEDKALLSAMHFAQPLGTWQFAATDIANTLAGQPVTMSRISSIPEQETEVVTSGTRSITVAIHIDYNGYNHIVSTASTSWEFRGAGQSGMETHASFSFISDTELGTLQTELRGQMPGIVLSVSADQLVIEGISEDIDELEVDDSTTSEIYYAVGNQTSTTELVGNRLVLDVVYDSSDETYRVSHAQAFGGDSKVMAATITGVSSRSKFSSLVEFATDLFKTAGANLALSGELGFDIRGVWVDQPGAQLIVTDTATDHGDDSITLEFGSSETRQFGE